MARLLRLAGYSVIGLTLPTGLLRDRVFALKHIFEDEGLEVVSRVDLAANSRMELLRLLRRFRPLYDIIGVKCVNQTVTSIACRDRRVDLIFFDPTNARIRFGHSFASQLRGSLEFNIMSTLLGETVRGKLSKLTKEAVIAQEHRNGIILSSGSASPAMIRSPSQIAAIGKLIGLSEGLRNRAVSEAIISRNKQRRLPEYIEEGVKVVTAITR
jgi:RNase P/RNase MRP subunit p30